MSNSNHLFVRTEDSPVLPPPISQIGIIGWARRNLFSSVTNSILTIIGIVIAYWTFSSLLQFAVLDAVWVGEDRDDCLAPPDSTDHIGACWAYVSAYFPQFIYGLYPVEERFRVDIVYFLFLILLIPLAMPSIPYKSLNALLFFVVFPIVAYLLLVGGVFGMPFVETTKWGGLLVTLVIAITGIVISLPLGIFLALGRRSNMPAIRMASILFIEFWRGVPLITILFMASVMLPLFLPEGVTFDKLLRVLIGVTFFASAYMAEVVRGGLQAIPRGQYEGAIALGLKFWLMIGLVILPQALKLVIPGIVNSFIGLFKDTTLVLIVGMFDLLGQIQLSFSDPTWSTPSQNHTGYLFAAFVFWIFCFGMSRYSIYVEKLLNTEHR